MICPPGRKKTQSVTLQHEQYYLNPKQTYHARSFWTGKVHRFTSAGLKLQDIPANGCRLLALRPTRSYTQYLGSNLHISQGLEVTHWKTVGHKTALTINRPGNLEGYIDLHLPTPPHTIIANGMPIKHASDNESATIAYWSNLSQEHYRIFVRSSQTVHIDILTDS